MPRMFRCEVIRSQCRHPCVMGRRAICWKPPIAITRTVVTDSIEPPPWSRIPERPCTAVLTEDANYHTDSWKETFAQILPQERGIHFCSLSLIDAPTLQERLTALEQDLRTLLLSNVVLISRGPLVSLVAQYYLESLPLLGLVMIDPILVDSKLPILQQVSAQHYGERDLEFVQDVIKETRRPLKLEPGAVPMLVAHSTPDPDFEKAATEVAARHCVPDGIHGVVPVHNLSATSDDEIMKAIDMICDWIDERVL